MLVYEVEKYDIRDGVELLLLCIGNCEVRIKELYFRKIGMKDPKSIVDTLIIPSNAHVKQIFLIGLFSEYTINIRSERKDLIIDKLSCFDMTVKMCDIKTKNLVLGFQKNVEEHIERLQDLVVAKGTVTLYHTEEIPFKRRSDINYFLLLDDNYGNKYYYIPSFYNKISVRVHNEYETEVFLADKNNKVKRLNFKLSGAYGDREKVIVAESQENEKTPRKMNILILQIDSRTLHELGYIDEKLEKTLIAFRRFTQISKVKIRNIPKIVLRNIIKVKTMSFVMKEKCKKQRTLFIEAQEAEVDTLKIQLYRSFEKISIITRKVKEIVIEEKSQNIRSFNLLIKSNSDVKLQIIKSHKPGKEPAPLSTPQVSENFPAIPPSPSLIPNKQ